jgi:hypothetical protein
LGECEVRVHVTNSNVLQTQSNINRLIKTKKIAAPAPLIESSDNFSRQLSFLGSSPDIVARLEPAHLRRQTVADLAEAGCVERRSAY